MTERELRETSGKDVISPEQVTLFRDTDPNDRKFSKGLQVHIIIEVVDRHRLKNLFIATQVAD